MFILFYKLVYLFSAPEEDCLQFRCTVYNDIKDILYVDGPGRERERKRRRRQRKQTHGPVSLSRVQVISIFFKVRFPLDSCAGSLRLFKWAQKKCQRACVCVCHLGRTAARATRRQVRRCAAQGACHPGNVNQVWGKEKNRRQTCLGVKWFKLF